MHIVMKATSHMEMAVRASGSTASVSRCVSTKARPNVVADPSAYNIPGNSVET